MDIFEYITAGSEDHTEVLNGLVSDGKPAPLSQRILADIAYSQRYIDNQLIEQTNLMEKLVAACERIANTLENQAHRS